MNPWPFLITLLIFVCLGSQPIEASSKPVGDTLRMGVELSYTDTMESTGGYFKLGFFSTLNSTKYYLGIWFGNASNDKPVWVANRESPFSSSSVCLTFDSNGNLALKDGNMWYYITNTSVSPTYATLLDSGNLVLLNHKNSAVIWQSFYAPTDTILPGMRTEYDNPFTLRSWKSIEDPAPGDFSLNVQNLSLLVVMRRADVYGVYNGYFDFGNTYNRTDARFNHSLDSGIENELTWKAVNRIVLEVSGEVNQQFWSNEEKRWISVQSSICGHNDLCGNFGICNPQNRLRCNCLQGFEPYDEDSWRRGNTSLGCVRRIPLSCSDPNKVGREDQFLLMTKVDLPPNQSLVPNITSAVECQKLCSGNCSCFAYTYDEGCLYWKDQLLNLKNISVDVADYTDHKSFFLKLAAPEFDNNDTSNTEKERHRRMLTIILPITLVALSTLSLSCWYYLRNMKSRKGEDLLLFDLGMNKEVDSTEHPQVEMLRGVRNGELKLPLFSFSSVAAATGNFSPDNKLGEGGFGPVFKGKLLNGDEVAVKRLSKKSGQGWEELENEALLIAKLQHRNLVRLLGCCIEKDEKILIYEFMPNKSLDLFLFDPTKRTELDWEARVRIIDGIAQGLLYLHEFSRLRIIHRDLKASNILLDVSMTPKISDFGMARIFGGNEMGANTRRIVGTYGYMSPEYAVEGHFSVKSDVFSFGVLVLEILTGKKNTEFFRTKSLNLLNHAWELWKSNKVMEIIDSTMKVASEAHRVHRYVNIGFLCVQESPTDRPTMSEIVSMFRNDTAILPYPKQPAFTSSRSREISSQGSLSLSMVGGSVSYNELTISQPHVR